MTAPQRPPPRCGGIDAIVDASKNRPHQFLDHHLTVHGLDEQAALVTIPTPTPCETRRISCVVDPTIDAPTVGREVLQGEGAIVLQLVRSLESHTADVLEREPLLSEGFHEHRGHEVLKCKRKLS